jgi:methionyl-tRNA formyltransferase
MLMNEGMDTGDILLRREVLIREGELVDSLTERLSLLGAELIVETIERFDTLLSVEQNHDLATYTRLLKKSDRLIHWEWDAEKVFGVYRAMTPVPGVYTFFRGKRLLVKSMEYRGDASRELDNLPGTVLSADENGLVVSCGGGTLSILSCQPECKKPVSARDFINGCQIKPGERLGE